MEKKNRVNPTQLSYIVMFHMIVPTPPYPKHIQAKGKKYPKPSNLNSKSKPTMPEIAASLK